MRNYITTGEEIDERARPCPYGILFMRITQPRAYGRWNGRISRGERVAVNSRRSQCDCRPLFTPHSTITRRPAGLVAGAKSLTTANFIALASAQLSPTRAKTAAVTTSVSQTTKINRELKHGEEPPQKPQRDRDREIDSVNIVNTHTHTHKTEHILRVYVQVVYIVINTTTVSPQR